MVEHLSCKQKVMGSIPIVAFHIFYKKEEKRKKNKRVGSKKREAVVKGEQEDKDKEKE